MAGSITPAEAAQGQDYAAALTQDMANFDPSKHPIVGEVAGAGGVGSTLQGPATINDNGNGTLKAEWTDDSGQHQMTFTGQGFDVHSDGYSVWTTTGSKDGAHVPLTHYDDPGTALPDGAPQDATVVYGSGQQTDNSSKFATMAINGDDGGSFSPLISINPYNPADVQLNTPSINLPVLSLGGEEEPEPSKATNAADFTVTLGDFAKDLAYASVLKDIKNKNNALDKEYNASTALEHEAAMAENASEAEKVAKSFERADGFFLKWVAIPTAVAEFGIKSYHDIVTDHERPEHALIKEGVSTALPLLATYAAGTAIVALAPVELPVVGVAIGVAIGVTLLDKAKVINGKSLTEWAGESAADFITQESGKGAYQYGYGPPVEQ